MTGGERKKAEMIDTEKKGKIEMKGAERTEMIEDQRRNPEATRKSLLVQGIMIAIVTNKTLLKFGDQLNLHS